MSFFDPLSFALGAGLGGGAAVLLRRGFTRKSAAELSRQEDRPSAAREFIAPQAGKRYHQELLQFLQTAHLFSDQVRLQDILVEPRFIKSQAPVTMIDEDEGLILNTDVDRVIPFLHQFPAVYAAFNMDTISLRDLETGNRQVAILGTPGSGKSTALFALGLLALGVLDLEALKVQHDYRFDEEDEAFANLPPEARERRRKEREEVLKKAMEQLRMVQQSSEEMAALEQLDAEVDFEKLLPVYVHLHHVNLDSSHYGGSIDPLEPIVQGAQHYLSRSTGVVSTPMLYAAMQAGRAIILIDGYDDLLPQQREDYYHWLQALVQYYGDNFIVMTGPATGYDALLQLGFAPAFIRPLTEARAAELIHKWVSVWEGGDRPAVSENVLRMLESDNRNRSFLDVGLKIWAALTGDLQESGRRGYYERYVRHHLGKISAGRPVLSELAMQWLQNGRYPDNAGLHQLTRQYEGNTAEIKASEDEAKKKRGAPLPRRLADQLAHSSLMHRLANGGAAFRHPAFAWYLAGEALEQAPAERMAELAHLPNWQEALGFAASVTDVEAAVLQRLQSIQNNPDLLYTKVFSVADWMPDAPDKLRWKPEILKRFRGVLLSPNQFPIVREFALAALVASRSSDATYIFREAVRSGNPHIRMLGCLGVGAMGSDKAVVDLTPMLVDEVVEVKLAAGLALGAIGTEEALTVMAEALLTGDEQLQIAIAEALASIEGEGHAMLYDGVKSEDLMVRRASAHGLSRIPETWALIALYRTMIEDSQWSVRNMAERAFARAREPRQAGPRLYPEPSRYNWLVDWAAERGESVPDGDSGRQLLLRALELAPPPIRIEAARALGHLGHSPAIKALYSLLADREADIRTAAFDALGKMSQRYTQPLPGL